MASALLSIFLLHWVVLLTPGVNFVLIGGIAAGSSRRSACGAALGISLATLVWAALAVAGVDAVFGRQPALRQAVRLAAAAYLLYVAARLWRAARASGPATRTLSGVSDAQAMRMGLVTNLGNPKPIFFFGSIFVSLLPPHTPAPVLAACVVIAFANSLLWHLLLATLLSSARVRAVQARHASRLDRAAAVVLALMAVQLVASRYT